MATNTLPLQVSSYASAERKPVMTSQRHASHSFAASMFVKKMAPNFYSVSRVKADNGKQECDPERHQKESHVRATRSCDLAKFLSFQTDVALTDFVKAKFSSKCRRLFNRGLDLDRVVFFQPRKQTSGANEPMRRLEESGWHSSVSVGDLELSTMESPLDVLSRAASMVETSSRLYGEARTHLFTVLASVGPLLTRPTQVWQEGGGKMWLML
ncbi:hypothetical protein RRG08_003843 [Elysia crispata]|uniref:Uncharacterized protein n=1 Tax=Elysia crispata TaxID=231223 RepID=A0AAE1DEJ4_9GAST|nr:hypothetical protein RRG08_003843 [Elysia crispata]